MTFYEAALRVLEDAGLVDTRKVGRVRECELGRDRLDNLEQWITDYRQAVEQRLDRMEQLLERRKGEVQ